MTSPSATPRSLTQMLRDSADGMIAGLLVSRPDLAMPAPATFSQVASRATTRESVRRALDELDSVDLWVAERAGELAGPISATDIGGVDVEVAETSLERLRMLALLWGDPGALRPVRALATELARSPFDAPPEPGPPEFDDAPRQPPVRVDEVAAGSAFELVRRIEVLVEHTDHVPLRLRSDGALAQREIRTVASLLDMPVAVALQHTQIAQAAGLIGALVLARGEALVPTADSDTWHGLPLVEQWTRLAGAWREHHPPSGSAALKALSFRAFGPAGEARVIGPAEMQRWLSWHRPRRAEEYGRRAILMLSQAAWIGVTGLGALASFGPGDDVSTLDRLLPDRVDKVLLQNDLTAVAPGPLTPYAASELGSLADVESRGGATVYRFTVESLRRAHAAGWSSEQITAALEARSRTPVPQPLRYLIGDLDRARAASALLSPGPAGHRPIARRQSLRGEPRPLPGRETEPVVDSATASRIVSVMRRSAVPEEDLEARGVTAAEGMADPPLETLREAVETAELVWIGFLDAQGNSSERLVYATSVEEGRLLARDSRSDERFGVPVHRITAAHIIRGRAR